jgi:hypothetical protein
MRCSYAWSDLVARPLNPIAKGPIMSEFRTPPAVADTAAAAAGRLLLAATAAAAQRTVSPATPIEGISSCAE